MIAEIPLLYDALPHGVDLHCIESLCRVEEGGYKAGLTLEGTLGLLPTGQVSPSFFVEALAQAGALILAAEEENQHGNLNPVGGGMIVKVKNCSCRLCPVSPEESNQIDWTLHFEVREETPELVVVAGSVACGESVCGRGEILVIRDTEKGQR